jgi:hypothetical protein
MKISLAAPIHAMMRRKAARQPPGVDDLNCLFCDQRNEDAAKLAASFFCGLASGNYV